MANTCRELIIDAYQISGVRGTEEDPTDNDTKFALRILNTDVIDQLRLDELWPSYVKEYTFVTRSSVAEYTIGVPTVGHPDPDIIVQQELVRIENAQVQIGNVWTPLRQISNTDYYRQTIAQGSYIIPQQFMYNRTKDPYDRFILSVGAPGAYPIRISCGGIVLNYNLDDIIDLPSGYYSALKYALAELLCVGAGLEDTEAKMRAKYSACLDRLKEVNAEPPPKLRLQGAGGLWSIGVDRVLYGNQGI